MPKKTELIGVFFYVFEPFLAELNASCFNKLINLSVVLFLFERRIVFADFL